MVVLYLFLLLLAVVFIFARFSRKKPCKKCPGPPGIPVVGNAFQLNNNTLHITLSEWAYKYGPIFEFSTFGQRIVVLNNETVLRQAMSSDAYRNVFASRQASFYGEHVLSGSESIAFTYDIDLGLKLRKAFTKAMHIYGEGIKDFEDVVLREIGAVSDRMKNYEGRDFDPTQLIKVSLGNVISILLNGKTINDHDMADDVFWQFTHLSDAILNTNLSLISTVMPFLRFVPGKLRRLYVAIHKTIDTILEEYVTKMKATYAPGKVRGLADFMFQSQQEDINAGRDVLFTNERIHNTTSETVAAGLNTSVSTICSIVLCLIHDQERQERLYQEIVNVFGTDQSPTIKERSKMPYMEAVIQESLRYAPPLAVAIPHLCTQDVEFEGYNINKGDVVIMNLWHVLHDEAVYEDPFVFRPERFLDEDGDMLPPSHPLRRSFLAFGIGRRQCIGEGLARSRIFLLITTLLQRYRFLPPADGECLSKDPRTYRTGIVQHPDDFNCRIESR